MSFRCIYQVNDSLHDFATRWLRGNPALHADGGTAVDGALVQCLHRDGAFQVELCTVRGGVVIPPHVHPAADTIELGVSGAMRLIVNGVAPFAAIDDATLARRWSRIGVRINHCDVHGATVPAGGTTFLSIQRWRGQPRSVLTDYVGQRLGAQHEAMHP